MPAFLPYTLCGQQLVLTKERTIFWEEERCLILSDLHLGKTGHFRKNGIPVPVASNTENMQRFISQVQYFKPLHVIIVGDLFHSHLNKEAEFFLKWRKDIQQTDICLVLGNHDVMDDGWYAEAGIRTEIARLQKGPFLFTHGDQDIPDISTGTYVISGHIHPSVSIRGTGKQSINLPCFYFAKNKAILPAFGNFTGRFRIEPSAHESVFIVTKEEVIQMQ